MSGPLVRYEAARAALAAAKAVDEVKLIRDKAEAWRQCAIVAKNRDMEIDAAEIRIRAERTLGGMILAQKETVGLNTGARGIGTSAVPRGNHTPPTLAEAGIDKKLSARSQKLAVLPEERFEANLAEWREQAEASEERAPTKIVSALTAFSGENEYYTPARYVDAAREVMGSIDLDPASCEMAQETVKAVKFFTTETDGLAQEWHGRIWLNPPYATGLIDKFVAKLIEELEARHVDQAIVLVDNRTDTAWFHALASCCDRLCFTRGRINFYNEQIKSSSPANGSAFFYFGPLTAGFDNIFCRFGFTCSVKFPLERGDA